MLIFSQIPSLSLGSLWCLLLISFNLGTGSVGFMWLNEKLFYFFRVQTWRKVTFWRLACRLVIWLFSCCLWGLLSMVSWGLLSNFYKRCLCVTITHWRNLACWWGNLINRAWLGSIFEFSICNFGLFWLFTVTGWMLIWIIVVWRTTRRLSWLLNKFVNECQLLLHNVVVFVCSCLIIYNYRFWIWGFITILLLNLYWYGSLNLYLLRFKLNLLLNFLLGCQSLLLLLKQFLLFQLNYVWAKFKTKVRMELIIYNWL